MAQVKQNKSADVDTEIALVTVLKLESIKKNNDLLFEGIALSRFIVIEAQKKTMLRSEEVAGVEITNKSPYIIIHLKNNQTIEIGE